MRSPAEGQLVDWIYSSRDYFRIVSSSRLSAPVLYSSFAIWLVINYISRGGSAVNPVALLLTFELPALRPGFCRAGPTVPITAPIAFYACSNPSAQPDDLTSRVSQESDASPSSNQHSAFQQSSIPNFPLPNQKWTINNHKFPLPGLAHPVR